VAQPAPVDSTVAWTSYVSLADSTSLRAPDTVVARSQVVNPSLAGSFATNTGVKVLCYYNMTAEKSSVSMAPAGQMPGQVGEKSV